MEFIWLLVVGDWMLILSTCRSIFDYDDNDEGWKMQVANTVRSHLLFIAERGIMLPFSEHKSRLRVEQRTIPVDKMYSNHVQHLFLGTNTNGGLMPLIQRILIMENVSRVKIPVSVDLLRGI